MYLFNSDLQFLIHLALDDYNMGLNETLPHRHTCLPSSEGCGPVFGRRRRFKGVESHRGDPRIGQPATCVPNAMTITAVIVCTFVFSLLQTPTNLPFSRLGHCCGWCSLLRHMFVCKNEPEVDWFRHSTPPSPLHLPCAKPSLRWIIFDI